METDLFYNALPFLIAIVLAMLIPTAMILLSMLFSPKRPPESDTSMQLSVYECGLQEKAIQGTAEKRFNVRFYLTAMFFLVFDVEVLFLFTWAIWFLDQSLYGYMVMFVFLGILTFGEYYLYKRGALEWE